MNLRLAAAVGLCALLVAAASVSAQQRATLTLVPSLNRINPGGVVEVEVFVNDVIDDPTPGVTNLLRAYQAQVEIVPLPGATGSLSLASITDPIFVDATRSDYVFLGLPIISATNLFLVRLGAGLLDAGQSIEVLTPKYCGTYVFQASPDADGDFQINFFHPDGDADSAFTFLIESSDPEALIPVDVFGTTITVALEPENDDCVDSAVILDGVTPFSTANTTTDGPPLSAACDEGSGTTLEQDVWYDYTASCTGILTISTCNDADFDTRLAVYGDSTATCACPISNTFLVGCNDDSPGCAAGSSELALDVTQGNCYKIRLGGSALGQTGTGNLTITCVGNDTCPSATTLSVPAGPSGVTIDGATLNATADAGLPVCGPAFDSPGVWYSVTGTGGQMTASLCAGASYDSRVSVFSGSCGALSCVANANDTCASQESVSWCSALGVSYKILVSGVGGQDGTFTLNVSSDDCNDSDACTDDSCSGGACIQTPNFDPSQFCCTPSTGSLCLLDDANPCTNDSCIVSTGTCLHSPVPDGPEPACDDALTCTFDQCISGLCAQSDINIIPCTGDSDCPNENLCDTSVGFCVCVPAPTVELIADAGLLPVANCYSAATNEVVRVRVEMGFAPPQNPIVGGQFFLAYDPLTLDFVSMAPGSSVDPGSPFSLEFIELVDETLGTIDYLVGVNLGDSGTAAASTLAVITFQAIAECNPFVVFRASGPNGEPNRLAGIGGVEVLPDALTDLPPISTNGSAPIMTSCPADILDAPDAGLFTATVFWTSPTANDSCDGLVQVICTPPSGSNFPLGITTVTCDAVNSCGVSDTCSFEVDVQPGTLTVDIQLSPTMAPGPVVRCITFDFWDCDAPAPDMHSTAEQDISFTAGLATGITLPIPGGNWECVTARDRLHTLASTAADFSTLDGFSYNATFVGDRATGGHWLLNGNLNDDRFIDILDYAAFLTEFLSPSNPDTPCGTAAPDANFNADNVVDLVDFVFIQVNSFQASEASCCGSVAAASNDGPLTEISIKELRRRGLYHLRFADLNGDGILDAEDVNAFMTGSYPLNPRPHKQARPERSLRPG